MAIGGYVDPNELQCEECMEVFLCKNDLSVHWREAHGPKMYPCNICGLKFILPSILKRHKAVVHNNDSAMSTPHQCFVCKLQFITEEVLERHHELVHPQDFYCGHCGEVFKLKRQLRHHLQGKPITFITLAEYGSSSKASSIRQLDEREDNKENCPFSTKALESKEALEISASEDHSSSHACGKCSKVFSSLSNLRKHTYIHTSVDGLAIPESLHPVEKPHVCKECGMRFSHKSHLILHIKDHNKSKADHCSLMSDAVISGGKNEGIKDEHEGDQYKCQFCNEVCESKQLLKTHVSDHHKSRHVCDKCGKVLSSAVALTNHLDMHTGVERVIASRSTKGPIRDEHGYRYNCSFCVGYCKSEYALKAHIERKHISCVCDKCGKVLSSLESLRSHMNNVHKGKVGKFICMMCDKRFKKKSDLRSHLRTHTNERPYVCETCSRSFRARSSYKSHACSRKDKSYNCRFCKKTFSSEEMVEAHIRSDHKSQVCGKCNKIIRSSSAFIDHMNSHNGIKPFACTFCEKRFVRKDELICHLRIHTGEKPFVCKVCCRNFTHKVSLIRHLCLGPPEESGNGNSDKQYKCPFCPQVFSSEKTARNHIAVDHNSRVCEICGKVLSVKHLKAHMNSHNGVKPFACTFCEKRFVERFRLIGHLRIHTGERPYVCEVCSKGFISRTRLRLHKCRGSRKKPSKRKASSENSVERVEADEIQELQPLDIHISK